MLPCRSQRLCRRLIARPGPVYRYFGSTNVLQASADSLESLPPLNRPLGVRERPTIFHKTTDERLRSYLNPTNIDKERKHIIREANKGYFQDLNLTRKHGGKTWIAPKVLIREEKSLYLPNISGRPLSGGPKKDTTLMCFGRISILALLGTKISEVHARGFTEGVQARFSSNPLFQYIQVNLQENLLKAMLVNLFVNSLRSTVPPELHANYLVSSQNLEYFRDPMGCTNSKVGYVYLVDEYVKIRWAGCADALVEEATALETCTGVLLKRLEKEKRDELKRTPSLGQV